MFINRDYRLQEDLYILEIEEDKLFAFYAPLRKLTRGIYREALEELLQDPEKLRDYLTTSGFDKKIVYPKDVADEPLSLFDFNDMFISLTQKCNLRCTYCYTAGGNYTQDLDPEALTTLLDYIPGAARRHDNKYKLLFHGDGETLVKASVALDFADKVKELARIHNFKLEVSATTNLTLLTEDLVKEMKTRFTHLNLSFDGDAESTDTHRLLPNGTGISVKFLENLELIKKYKIPFGIRGTISKEFVSKLPSMVQFANDVLFKDTEYMRNKGLALEPAVGIDRNGVDLTVDPDEFIIKIKEAIKLANSLGIPLKTSFVRIEAISNYFCGTGKVHPTLLPDGSLSSCSRITHDDSPSWDQFAFGKFNKKTRNFDIDQEAVSAIRSRWNVKSMPECEDCFAKWHCSGGCPAARACGFHETIGCKISRELTREAVWERHLKRIEEMKKAQKPKA